MAECEGRRDAAGTQLELFRLFTGPFDLLCRKSDPFVMKHLG